MGGIHQGLNFHQQRPCTLAGYGHRTARRRGLGAIQKNSRGFLDLAQALFGHGENAQLVDGAKTVLDRPQGAITAIAIAVQQQRSVNHVLEYFRARQTALFGDVSHQDDNLSGLFGMPGQHRSRLAHLGNAARGGGQFGDPSHLD